MATAPKRTRQGDKGEAVKTWQLFLNLQGFSVGKADGIHGAGTEKASLAWEAAQAGKPAAAPAKAAPAGGAVAVSAATRKAIDAVLSIFETGKLPSAAAYATCTVLKDGAGISYGKHQCTDKAGSLDLVVKRYIELGGAQAAALGKYLPQLATNESTKVDPAGPFPAWLTDLIAVLKVAGKDPVMQQAQDEVFDEVYFAPAVQRAAGYGLTTALGLLTVYDTCIHSGPGRVATHAQAVKEPAPKAGGDEKRWVTEYIGVRRAWLGASSNALVQRTVYRMDALIALIRADNWDLRTPFEVRGVTVGSGAVA